MHPKNHRAIISQKQKHLIHTKAQTVHHGESSFANWEGGCISVKSEIMLLNSRITIEAGGISPTPSLRVSEFACDGYPTGN